VVEEAGVEYLERITDHGQATGKLYHLRVSFRKTCVIGQKVDLSGIERVSDCCLLPIKQFFSYIMARTS
jgi:hypothetical protein